MHRIGELFLLFWQRDVFSICPVYWFIRQTAKGRGYLLSVACCFVYDAESPSNTRQNFKWATHFNGNNKADYRVLVYKHDTSLHFQKRLYVTLFQVVYCVINELCFVLSHLLIRHKRKCLYQMLVNIMIFSILTEKRCELLRLYSVGSGRMT
jgi:hypothetical protein